ncbi:outer membrane protein [Pseudochrobactrum asaccharolyticum]|jgi:outer membrane immunogenic protein|uniref:Outer membrane immunogenic protein n=2 Tax=cellular organisms TaxID=131567 RepID=A0A366E944_9HYPH|nr:outer membrane protein [Pseudochrobactrum asaccharolyticum]MBX8800421.1 porin family protein [Ochrobactrum sp. MR28]MBX8816263.1 porin family protein [Ochrobactrum sp. MR31]MCF7671070.1 porin family protein [Bacillus subtilis]MDR2312030.1 porin family protein [Brucellaceae bacterium]MCF7646964.1 porin family protein [Pseudochrobactrum asaccharolyticum]
MRIIKSMALASVALLPLSATAFAADAIQPQTYEPVAPVVDVAPQSSWAGGYTGLYLGYGINKYKTDTGLGDLKDNNAKFGGYAGWNFQNDNIVYGLEGDAGYNWAKKEKLGVTAKSGFDGSLRARLGVDMGPVMPYVTAGVAGTQVKFSDATSSEDKFRVGWTAGAGAETFLTQNVTARLEYRYTDFGKKDFQLNSGTVSDGGLQSHDIRLGVGYKF